MYSGMYDVSAGNIKKAYSINPSNRYQEALSQIKNEKTAAEKLKAQEGGSPQQQPQQQPQS
jgi:hypothetical protein